MRPDDRELGYVPAIRDSMRRVWADRPADAAADRVASLVPALRAARVDVTQALRTE